MLVRRIGWPTAPSAPARVEWFGFLLLCAIGALVSLWQVSGWGDALSRVDAYSEANAIRGTRNFVERGFAETHGLPRVFYPGLYPAEGFAAETVRPIPGVTDDGVYTHYPPGPEYLLAGAMALLGAENIAALRLAPIALCGAAALCLGLAVRRRFDAATGWIAMAACLGAPSFHDANSYLHYDGYAQALLLVEIAVVLVRPRAAGSWLAVLGFLQGWLSFDYAFLVAAAPLALEMPLSRLDRGDGWRAAWTSAVLAGGGFALAHALHLAQVGLHLGGMAAAVHDLLGAAAHRSGVLHIHGPLEYIATVNAVLVGYIVGAEPIRIAADDMTMFRFLGCSLGAAWFAVTVALALHPRARRRLRDWFAVSLSATAVSCLWYVVMVNHAIVHRHFLYRHLFFAFFVQTLFAIAAFRTPDRRPSR